MSKTINELSKEVKEFWNNNDDFHGVVYVVDESNENEDGTRNGIFATHGSEVEIQGVLMIIAHKCGIPLNQMAYLMMAIAADKDAMKCLNEMEKMMDNCKEKDDESQRNAKCCGRCNRNESDKNDSKEEIIEKLLKQLFDED